MSELKSCPHCGASASASAMLERYIGGAVNRKHYRCECRVCHATFANWYRRMTQADADWNRRAQPEITGETSDGYHTFNELYHHRAVLFSVICNNHPALAWKSKLHHDGTMYDGMFIVGINTPDGQATYHYDVEPYWKMFRVPELPHAPEWDGHTPAQAIERIGKLSAQPDNEPLTLDELRKMRGQVVDIPESEFWYSGRGTVLDDGVYDPKDQDGYWPFKYYGEWLAYDHKQGGEQDG